MMCYVIYDTTTGRVVSAGACPDDAMDGQRVDGGYGRLIVPLVPVDPSRYRVVDANLVEVESE